MARIGRQGGWFLAIPGGTAAVALASATIGFAEAATKKLTGGVYALDVPSLGLSGNFTGVDAQAAIAKQVLAKSEVVGTYTQNPALMKTGKSAS